MDLLTDIAPLPGVLANEPLLGGIATGLPGTTSSDMSLLYRYNTRVLEVRNTALLVPSQSEPLATLSTTQLQVNDTDELDLARVQPILFDDNIHFLVYARDAATNTGVLSVFNPFTLAISPVPTRLPGKSTSLAVSVPFDTGAEGAEWQFSVVALDKPKGKVVLGCLTVRGGIAQMTSQETHVVGAKGNGVTAICISEIPGGSGAVLVLVGTEDGCITVLEYSPFGSHPTLVVGEIGNRSQQAGRVTKITTQVMANNKISVASAHARTAHGTATVMVYLLSFSHRKQLGQKVSISKIDSADLWVSSYTDDDDTQNLPEVLAANASISDLAFVSVDGSSEANGLFLSALASVPFSERLPNPTHMRRSRGQPGSSTASVVTALSTWRVEDQQLTRSYTTSQVVAGSERVLGMRTSGRRVQVEVATDRHLLAGDIVSIESAVEDPATQFGLGVPLSIDGYIDMDQQFPYTPAVRNAVFEQRQRMEGELFIDLLLRMAGVASGSESSSAYPPRMPTEGRQFIETIGQSDIDGLKQHSIAYYLLLDMAANAMVTAKGTFVETCKDATTACTEAHAYAQDLLIPQHFVYLVRGFWLMDHGETTVGLSYLSDPSVVADWAPKILRTAVAGKHYFEARQFLTSATATTSTLQPRLEDQPSEASVVMDVLLQCDLGEAFSFQRRQSQHVELRRALLVQMFEFGLSASSKRAVVDRLATLPLDETEEEVLESYCVQPLSEVRARDFLALHYVNCGRYVEAIRVFQGIAKDEQGVAQNMAQKRKSIERQAMVQNLMMLLPEAQRWVVNELHASSGAFGSSEQVTTAKDSMDVDSSDDAEVGQQPRNGISKRMPINVPLSASKTSRLVRPVVGTHGAQQDPSHALMRVLVKQMAVVKPAVVQRQPAQPYQSASNEAMTTPKAKRTGSESQDSPQFKTPVTSFAQRTSTLTSPISLRVPFSGPPTTPRQESQAEGKTEESPVPMLATPGAPGYTPGRNVLAHTSNANSPVVEGSVLSQFPEIDHAMKSPFQRAKHQARNAENDMASPPRYNMRMLTPTAEVASKESAKDLKPKPKRATRSSAARPGKSKSKGKLAAVTEDSARSFERAISGSGSESAQQKPSSSKTRKRTD
ncbi:hypothetical protein FBU59_001514 [Linderina macrospora]|uniref:Uncharacterized protein n=1 Tax=Linderina macrospora TaxID=4868 RepID=A0ACC1JDS3_9FUNG|nr:hypothetical protein FBU59_001514 [Linderina macrospora]